MVSSDVFSLPEYEVQARAAEETAVREMLEVAVELAMARNCPRSRFRSARRSGCSSMRLEELNGSGKTAVLVEIRRLSRRSKGARGVLVDVRMSFQNMLPAWSLVRTWLPSSVQPRTELPGSSRFWRFNFPSVSWVNMSERNQNFRTGPWRTVLASLGTSRADSSATTMAGSTATVRSRGW